MAGIMTPFWNEEKSCAARLGGGWKSWLSSLDQALRSVCLIKNSWFHHSCISSLSFPQLRAPPSCSSQKSKSHPSITLGLNPGSFPMQHSRSCQLYLQNKSQSHPFFSICTIAAPIQVIMTSCPLYCNGLLAKIQWPFKNINPTSPLAPTYIPIATILQTQWPKMSSQNMPNSHFQGLYIWRRFIRGNNFLRTEIATSTEPHF